MHWLKENWYQPIFITIFLTLLLGAVTLPYPWQKHHFFWAGDTDEKGHIIKFDKVELSRPFGIFLADLGVPTGIRFYDFHVKFNKTHYSPPDDISVLNVGIKKETEFGKAVGKIIQRRLDNPYLIDEHMAVGFYEFKIPVGKSITLNEIPINTYVNYSTRTSGCWIFESCPLFQSKDKKEYFCESQGICPHSYTATYWDMEFYDDYVEEAVEGYAAPNRQELFFKWFIIFAFWVVVVNSFVSLMQRRWKK